MMKKKFLLLQYRKITLFNDQVKRLGDFYTESSDILKFRHEINKIKKAIEKKSNELIDLKDEVEELQSYYNDLDIKYNFLELKIFLLKELEDANNLMNEFQFFIEKFNIIDKISNNDFRRNELINELNIENGLDYATFKRNIKKGYSVNKQFINDIKSKIASIDNDFCFSAENDFEVISLELRQLKLKINNMKIKINRREMTLEKYNYKLENNIAKYNCFLNNYNLLGNSDVLEKFLNNLIFFL